MNYLPKRHIGLSDADREAMLQSLGLQSMDELMRQVMPADIIMPEKQEPVAPLSEAEHLDEMAALAADNMPFHSLIGRGFYGTITPSVILRNVYENPVWYTSYTPYQAEISQGRLEALFVFQTMVSDLTGLPLANCSLLDQATAAAEAVTMMRNLRSRQQVKDGVKKIFVDRKIFPETLSVIRTRANGQEIELVYGDYAAFVPTSEYFGAIVQLPNADGAIEDYAAFIDACHQAEMKVAIIADLLALALLKPLNADIICGSAQRFGLPMGFGGPDAGYMATRNEFKREIPGRIIGLSKDMYEHPAFRLALQTREQHIKREKATSNICTAEALCAIMAGFYAVYHGPKGIRTIAETIHHKAAYLNEMLQAYGYKQENTEFFDTLKIYMPQGKKVAQLREIAEQRGYNFFYQDESVCLSIDETCNLDTMNDLIAIFCEASDNLACPVDNEDAFGNVWAIDESRVREIDFLTASVFNLYHTETEMMRYIWRLTRKDISLTHSMIPLGSCTMKLNAASEMLPVTFPGFGAVHPLAPANQVKGYMAILEDLQDRLCDITGMKACCLQPTSGAAGEYTGLVTIREYMRKNAENRKYLLIPASAHGTNPASCVQAGFEPIVIPTDENGNTNLQAWREQAEAHKDDLAGCMITYPSTHGIFEVAIREMCHIIHQNGGLVYMDGANMNAQIGYTCPGFIGADVCHLNLHKTFASPHGGGGPGVGAICVNERLQDCMPTHDLNRVSTAIFGNANMALSPYGYIVMMGDQGLRDATAAAILSANYMAAKLKDAYGIVYTGANNRVGHELILECRQFHNVGITDGEIAKRLMDYGYHAPTLSFPVHGTLMIEPTESESKAELDRFIDVLLHIREEIAELERGEADTKDNVLVNAPHPEYEAVADEWHHCYPRSKAIYPTPDVAQNKFFVPVAKVDNGFGDRNLVARF